MLACVKDRGFREEGRGIYNPPAASTLHMLWLTWPWSGESLAHDQDMQLCTRGTETYMPLPPPSRSV